MLKNEMLFLTRLIHTLIWIFYNVVIFYFLYAVLFNRIDIWLWVCLAFIVLEGCVLLLFKNICPLTLLARRYSDDETENFDIFLPLWLAKNNKLIYGSLVMAGLLVLMVRLLIKNQ